MLRDPGQHALNMDSVVLAQFRVNSKRFMQDLYLYATHVIARLQRTACRLIVMVCLTVNLFQFLFMFCFLLLF